MTALLRRTFTHWQCTLHMYRQNSCSIFAGSSSHVVCIALLSSPSPLYYSWHNGECAFLLSFKFWVISNLEESHFLVFIACLQLYEFFCSLIRLSSFSNCLIIYGCMYEHAAIHMTHCLQMRWQLRFNLFVRLWKMEETRNLWMYCMPCTRWICCIQHDCATNFT